MLPFEEKAKLRKGGATVRFSFFLLRSDQPCQPPPVPLELLYLLIEKECVNYNGTKHRTTGTTRYRPCPWIVDNTRHNPLKSSYISQSVKSRFCLFHSFHSFSIVLPNKLHPFAPLPQPAVCTQRRALQRICLAEYESSSTYLTDGKPEATATNTAEWNADQRRPKPKKQHELLGLSEPHGQRKHPP